MIQKAMQSLPGDIAAALGPILAEFAAKQGQKGSQSVETVESFQTFQDETPVKVQKPSPKLQRALDWLRDHPGDMMETNRAVAAKIGGISHTWVGKAKRIIRGK